MRCVVTVKPRRKSDADPPTPQQTRSNANRVQFVRGRCPSPESDSDDSETQNKKSDGTSNENVTPRRDTRSQTQKKTSSASLNATGAQLEEDDKKPRRKSSGGQKDLQSVVAVNRTDQTQSIPVITLDDSDSEDKKKPSDDKTEKKTKVEDVAEEDDGPPAMRTRRRSLAAIPSPMIVDVNSNRRKSMASLNKEEKKNEKEEKVERRETRSMKSMVDEVKKSQPPKPSTAQVTQKPSPSNKPKVGHREMQAISQTKKKSNDVDEEKDDDKPPSMRTRRKSTAPIPTPKIVEVDVQPARRFSMVTPNKVMMTIGNGHGMKERKETRSERIAREIAKSAEKLKAEREQKKKKSQRSSIENEEEVEKVAKRVHSVNQEEAGTGPEGKKKKQSGMELSNVNKKVTENNVGQKEEDESTDDDSIQLLKVTHDKNRKSLVDAVENDEEIRRLKKEHRRELKELRQTKMEALRHSLREERKKKERERLSKITRSPYFLLRLSTAADREEFCLQRNYLCKALAGIHKDGYVYFEISIGGEPGAQQRIGWTINSHAAMKGIYFANKGCSFTVADLGRGQGTVVTAGDVIGVYFDMVNKRILFVRNGKLYLPCFNVVYLYTRVNGNPAIYCLEQLKCTFNMGAKPFKYPPNGWDQRITPMSLSARNCVTYAHADPPQSEDEDKAEDENEQEEEVDEQDVEEEQEDDDEDDGFVEGSCSSSSNSVP